MAIFTNRETVNLAGSWAFIFDHEDIGVKSSWSGSQFPVDRAEKISVPGIWNTTHPGIDSTAFYQTHFTVPANWQGKTIELVFEGVSYITSVWVNGKYVGSHEGAYTPFRFDVTDQLRSSGKNTLAVRVSSLSKTRAVDGLKLKEAPVAKQAWYFPFGGIWGNVHLEALPKLACQSVRITPDLHQELVHVDLMLQNTLPVTHQANVKLSVKDPANQQVAVQTTLVSIPPGASLYTFQVPLPYPHLWSCQDPALYHLTTEVIDPLSQQLDVHETCFGMREFTTRDGQFYLNGDLIYLRGILLQPDYPISVVMPPDKTMIEREMRLVKEGGFNLLRVHLRPAAPGLLDLADEMGILVYAESSMGWLKDSPRMLQHGMREVEALIRRDYNHPSIVFWGVYNENPPAANTNGLELCSYARSLDTSRVVIHNSGGSLAIDQDFGWIDRAWVIPSFETNTQKAIDIHLYLGCYPTSSVYHWLQTVGTNIHQSSDLSPQGLGSAAIFSEFDRELHTFRGKVFVSEIGCGAFNDMDKTADGFKGWENLLDARIAIHFRDSIYQGFEQRGLNKVFGSPQRLFEQSQEMQSRGISRQVEAILTNPQVSGYIVTQSADLSWELEAGILDMWRNPKPAFHAIKRLNQPHCLITAPQTYSVLPGSSIWTDCSLVNQVALQGNAQIMLTVQNQSGDEVTHQTIKPEKSVGLHRLARIQLTFGDIGSYRVSTRLIRGKEVLSETIEIIHSLTKVNWDGYRGKVALWGSSPSLFSGAEFTNFFQPARPVDSADQVICISQPSEPTVEQWGDILKAVERGCKVIVGALNLEDKVAVNALSQAGITLEVLPGYGSWIGCHHWLPQTDLTEGLPTSGGLAAEVFTDTLPRYILAELGGTVLAGSIRSTQHPDPPKEIVWRSDIEQVTYGKGKLIFCQYRIFDQAYAHPVASRLTYNLVRWASNA
jgi:beta-galactosidase